jgi:short-subunit dehydrogenase
MAQGGRPTALVTGASGGIGADLARLLAAGGHDLLLVARSEGRLRAFAEDLSRAHGIRAVALAADLSRGEEVDRVARTATAEGAVDVLVNDAGFGLHGPFAATEWGREQEMILVNVVALTRLSKAILPGMVARRRGRILNVASTAGFFPGPFMAVYYATKAYVVSLSLALAEEVRGTGVTVTCLAPGATRGTAFAEGAGMSGSRLFRSPTVMDAPAVARAAYGGLMAGRKLVIPGLANRVMVESGRLAPRGLLARIARTLQDPSDM